MPATLSEGIIDGILRQELGFEGVVVSDAMNMAAIGNDYHSNDAAALFFKAGGDIMLMPNSLTAAHQGILDAVADGTISEDRLDQSVRRVLPLKRDCGLLYSCLRAGDCRPATCARRSTLRRRPSSLPPERMAEWSWPPVVRSILRRTPRTMARS